MMLKFNWKPALAVFLFLVLFVAGWPLYKYIFDVDGVGYAAVANEYAAGNFNHAVNGYWSPLHSWLIIPFLKFGLQVVTAFKISNAMIAVFILIVLNRVLKKYELNNFGYTGILFTASLLLVHYAWYELAADLLLVLWLLLYFLITSSGNFFQSYSKNILAALVAALAYFSKAYAFPFFLVHFLFMHLFVNAKLRRLDLLFTGILVFLLCCLPWMYLLYEKYGRWMIGTSGKLNASWYLVAQRNPDLLFFPPPYSGASSFWQDPWYVQKTFYTAFSSSDLFLHQLHMLLYNVKQWLKCLLEISVIAPLLLAVSIIRIFNLKQKRDLLFAGFFFLLPAGYLLIHIETRFLWVLSFLFLIAGAIWLQPIIAEKIKQQWLRHLLWIIFLVSFLPVPLLHLKNKVYHQQELHQLAQLLKKQNFKGNFTSNKNAQECMILAYLTGSSYFTPNPDKKSQALQTASMQQAGIQSCFFYYSTIKEKEDFLKLTAVKEPVKVLEITPGLLIVEVKPPL